MSRTISVPNAWELPCIGDITTLLAGYGFPTEYQGQSNGELPFFKVGDISEAWQRNEPLLISAKHYLTYEDAAKLRAKPLPKGSVVFAKIGAAISLNRRAILSTPSLIDNNCMGLAPNADVLNSNYLFYFTCTLRLGESSRASVVPSLRKSDIEPIPLPLPPLNEQRRIVAKIEELFSDLDAGVAALKRAKANLKRYRAAVLKAAVEGKLTEEWRANHPAKEPASALLTRILKERRQKWEADQLAKFAAATKEPPKNWRDKYVEPSPPDVSGLSDLPDGWCWVTLGQILHRIEGGKSFECLTRPAEPNEWGVVKVSAMTWGTFLEYEQKAIPPAAEFDPADEIRPNDLLLSRSNTTQLVGATVLVGNCRPRLLLSDKSLRLRAIEFVNLRWLHTVLSSSVARSQLSAMATGTSDSMRNVSHDKIKSVVFPLPPHAEQQWIVEEASERLSQIDAAETQIEHGLLRASRLRQSILKQAFEGKLVPQDPNDERACVLLERLRASRSHDGAKDKAATGARPRRTSAKSR